MHACVLLHAISSVEKKEISMKRILLFHAAERTFCEAHQLSRDILHDQSGLFSVSDSTAATS
jgi:hypothetical protein